MDEYIKRKDTLHILDLVLEDDTITHKYRAIRKRLKGLPTEDVEKVKHGEWIKKIIPLDWCDDDADIVYECSVCKSEIPFTSNFCPNCGAKMKIEEGE